MEKIIITTTIMTEIERIINEGILPANFFKPEVLCDFYVDENRKKVWGIQIELYMVLKTICEKHHLKLFTDGGTTIGAVRHKGFIPWDDDIDVCLLRKDYERLKSLAYEFSYPFFLQSPDTDSEYGFSFMRLCNSNTSYDVKPFTYAKFNKGLFIDIFPIDKVTQEDYLIRRKKISALIAKNSARMRKDFPFKSERDLKLIEQNYDSNLSTSDVWHEIENIATQDENIDTPFVSLLVSTQYKAEKKIWPKRVFEGDGIEKDFYPIKVIVPSGYDEQLKIYFGNYMEFPPVEERGTWHSATLLPDIPYKQYYHEKYGLY